MHTCERFPSAAGNLTIIQAAHLGEEGRWRQFWKSIPPTLVETPSPVYDVWQISKPTGFWLMEGM